MFLAKGTPLRLLISAFTMLAVSSFSQNCPDFAYEPPPEDWPAHFMDRVQLMLSAEESKACIQTPPGFSASLWASEDSSMGAIRSLVALNFDEQGRLWAAETFDYPHTVLTDPFSGSDRIVIVEDSDKDGTADNLKIFAEGLNLVTGLVHSAQGLVVAMAPHLLLFKDEDGDDVADNPKGNILYTGFNRDDTHATISNLHYGLDNWIYGLVGYSGGNVKGQNVSQSIIRFRTDSDNFEVLSHTSNNTWGFGLSEAGQIFVSTANQAHSFHQVYPGELALTPDHTSLETHPVTDQINRNNPGYAAAANHSLYTARHFPEKYWNKSAFVCDPTSHLCHQDFLIEKASSFEATEDVNAYNIFVSSDAWTAPIQALTGPDGALWVLDWYNYYVSHSYNNPRTQLGNAEISPLRDNQHSRVYRVTYDSSPLEPILDLKNATTSELLNAFNNPNLLWRLHAQRILLSFGPSENVIAELSTMLESKQVNSIGQSPKVVHALRTLEGWGLFEEEPETWVPILRELITHPSSHVRWNVIDALPIHNLSTSAILEMGRINDPDALVRIRAMYKLTKLPAVTASPMYSDFADLDQYSTKLFNELAVLEKVNELPTIPGLDKAVDIFPEPRTQNFQLVWNGQLKLIGNNPGPSGSLLLMNVNGKSLQTLPIIKGQIHRSNTLLPGIYLYQLRFPNIREQSGKVTVIQ